MIAIFAFDNSSNHTKLANDTFNTMNMNLNPNSKQSIMCDIIFNGQVQSIVFSSDYPNKTFYEKPKKMKVILQKYDLWNSGLKAFCDKSNILLENQKI